MVSRRAHWFNIMRRGIVAVLVFGSTARGGAAPPQAYRGTFALQGGEQRTSAHLLVMQRSARRVDADLWLTRVHSMVPIVRYDVDMTQRLHLIVIGDELSTFSHLHPRFQRDGHFRIAIAVPHPGLYHIYADWVPKGIVRQVFRFDVPFGDAAPLPRRQFASGATAVAGPYTVTLRPLRLDAHQVTMLHAHITRGGNPAQDLRPYLGTPAHAVFINTRDLSYVHVHPSMMGEMGAMEMTRMPDGDREMELSPGAHVAPDMMFHVGVRTAGRYRLWLQFRGGSTLYVARFVLTAV